MKTLGSKLNRDPNMQAMIFGLGGAVFFLFGFLVFTGGAFYTVSGEKANGQITGIEERRGRVSGTRSHYSVTYAPIVTFATPDRKTYTFTSGLSMGEFPKIGQRVDVLYNPKRPESAEINSFSALWLAPIGSFVGFLVFLMIGFAGRLAVQKRKRFLRDGARVDATITEVSAIKSIQETTVMPQELQSRAGWNISATAIDPLSGASRTYNGKLIGSKPGAINPLRLGAKTVPVYVDRTDPTQYYMDTNQLTPFNLFPEKFAGKSMFQQIGVMNELYKEAQRRGESLITSTPDTFMSDADKLFK